MTRYEAEVEELPETFVAAVNTDIGQLKAAVAGASESSIIGVGSGGSYTVATLLCNLHEKYTGRVSRPSTPLEIISNPTLAASSPVFLVSAEGKNPDAVETLRRARLHSSRAVHVLTNRRSSPLMVCAGEFRDVTPHVFELEKKDGYLATNSLLKNAVVVARAYGELDNQPALPTRLEDLRIGTEPPGAWCNRVTEFVRALVKRQTLFVIFSPWLRAIAADLESKLSEAALTNCQLVDLRSFAHGRHLWLADRRAECSILALVDPSLTKLWDAMRALLPTSLPIETMQLNGTEPRDLLAGLVAGMHLVGEIGRVLGRDPGNPDVPDFGRKLHYLHLPPLIAPPQSPSDGSERAKFEVLGARWPSIGRRGPMIRALEGFRSGIESQSFRAIVFDYDGTLSSSHKRELPPPVSIVEQLIKLVKGGLLIGIATGRGDSIRKHLQDLLPITILEQIRLGLYNCGTIFNASQTPELPNSRETSEFLSHVTRIARRLQLLGVPIDTIRATHPYQVSIRFVEGVQAEGNWFVIADALRQAGLDLSRIVRSKHSIDILAKGVNKSRLVGDIIQEFRIEPYQILTIGDQGAWPGNDSSLLEHRFSLSVDQPSRHLDRGWKLAPANVRDVDATLWYLNRAFFLNSGELKFRFSSEKVND